MVTPLFFGSFDHPACINAALLISTAETYSVQLVGAAVEAKAVRHRGCLRQVGGISRIIPQI
jgi:hypothetical protein